MKKTNNGLTPDLIYLGKLGKSVGLKGSMKVYLDTDFPDQLKSGTKVTTNKKIELTIESIDIKKSLIKFSSIDDVEEAKKLTNSLLYTTCEETKKTCKLEKNQYFWFDIVGCTIIEDGLLLGIVKDIHRYPITDYLEIMTQSELLEKGLPKTFLIPYDENYIKLVDIEAKEINTQNAYGILENS